MIARRPPTSQCAVAAAIAMLLSVIPSVNPAAAAEPAGGEKSRHSITNRSLEWPSWAEWQRVLSLEDYNTRVVVFGTAALGLAAGMVGSFTLLRKRALMGDALSHATLPGIALAFMLVTNAGGDGKSLKVLLTGAAVSGLVGMGCILFIRRFTRLKEDAALGIVLSVFFGAGVALLGIVQQMKTGHAAGLESFIYGKTASMIEDDLLLIAQAACICAAVCVLLFKELKLLCFDEGYAGARGYPVFFLDCVIMGLVTAVTVLGLQAVGLVLTIALLVIPAAAARFWMERMTAMTVLAAAIGAASCMLGAGISALFPNLPSGAMIVLVSTVFFLGSMLFGSARGILVRWLRRKRLNARVDRQHLLRGMFEILEIGDAIANPERHSQPVELQQLLGLRSWSAARLRAAIGRAAREGLLWADPSGRPHLNTSGFREAARLAREHRLWELYLIRYADVAPAHVDRDADTIEHVLDAALIGELESMLELAPAVSHSPHPLRLTER